MGKDTKKESRELYEAAQRRLVASLIADGSHISRVLELIRDDDVEEPNLHLIFSCMAELSRRNEPINTLSIGEMLSNEGRLKEAGGPAALYKLQLEGEKALIESPPYVYARIVKESSAKAKITQALDTHLPLFKDDSGVQAVDGVSDLQANLNETLLMLSDASTITRLSEDFDTYLDLLAHRREISEENGPEAAGLQGIPSLLPTLNRYTTGWLPGQLITVGARTGVGKSVFAIDCAIAAAKANSSVMFFSLEMGKDEIEDRLLAATTGVTMDKLKQGILNEEETRIVKAQMKEMKDIKLIIDVEPKITVDIIRARALRQAQTPAGLDFIIIDYLQLITPTGRFSSRQEAVADISRNVKLLAKQLGVPIMVLVQLNRGDDDNALPHLDKIRESGAIAQDSDVVVLLHRDAALDDTTPHTLIILAKNRNGEANKTIRCHSNLECSLFREVTRVKDVERLSEEDEDDLIEKFDLDDFEDEEFGDVL